MNSLLENAVKRPALVQGVGDFLDPVWEKAQTKVLSIPIWAFALGGLAYLLWREKPGFGLAGWIKQTTASWED